MLALLCLAACSAGDEAPTGDRIACAVDGASNFADVCFAERWRIEDTMYLVIRHPDGGFRRFEVLSDGRGIAAADGIEDAKVVLDGGVIEASVGEDRYRIPVKQGTGDAVGPMPKETEDVTQLGEGSNIACAVDGSNEFRPHCTMEPIEMDGERSVIVRHPDGGFRRFERAEGGIAPADGADFAEVGSDGGVAEIEVNGDVYRIPESAMENGGN